MKGRFGLLCPSKLAVGREEVRTLLSPCSSCADNKIHFFSPWAIPIPALMVPSPQRGEMTRGLPGVTRKRQLAGRNGTGCDDDSCHSCPHPPCQVRMSPWSTPHLPHTSLLGLSLTSNIESYTVPNELSSFVAG